MYWPFWTGRLTLFWTQTLATRRCHCFTAPCRGQLGGLDVLVSTDEWLYGIYISTVLSGSLPLLQVFSGIFKETNTLLGKLVEVWHGNIMQYVFLNIDEILCCVILLSAVYSQPLLILQGPQRINLSNRWHYLEVFLYLQVAHISHCLMVSKYWKGSYLL